jgi:microcystin-dependent protein
VPEFYVADGSIHVRLVNAQGVVQLDAQNTLVIGPSGNISSGTAVDPTTIFQTGDEIWLKSPSAAPRAGWVRQNGRTIGNATSGASECANADTSALYAFLWNNFAQLSGNTKCPVVGGLGLSAAADFAASKPVTLWDMRGRGPVGQDAMGSTSAGRLQSSNITSGGTDGTDTTGASGGEANHTLATNEMPTHTHPNTLTDPGHFHTYTDQNIPIGGAAGSDLIKNTVTMNTSTATTGITITNTSQGGGTSHNNMHPFALGCWYIKLAVPLFVVVHAILGGSGIA